MAAADLDLFRLLVFVTVVERNGYSAAAEHLGLSQATVSFHVRELTRQLRAPLVSYEHRAIHLTPAGEEVYRAAVKMLHDAERLVRAVGDIDRGYRGALSFGASMAFEQAYFMKRVIAPFCRAHPAIRLSLRFGHSVSLAEAVRSHRLDLAYVLGWRRPAGVRYQPLHRALFTFLVSPDHPLASQETVTVEQIARAGLITAPLDNVEWSYYDRVLRACGIEDATPALEIDGVQARVLAASAGLGVLGTFYPPYAGECAHAPLVALRVAQPLPAQEVGLVSRAGEEPSSAAEALADCLRRLSRPPASTSPAR
jgi:DNA-binding transcriptional LysR family regulator